MACVVYQTNKRTGTRYAYRSESYRDPQTGRPRSRREYLGRVDPETGEIIPKRARARRAPEPGGDQALEARNRELEERNRELEERVGSLSASLAEARDALAEVGAMLATASSRAVGAAGVIGGALDGEGGET